MPILERSRLINVNGKIYTNWGFTLGCGVLQSSRMGDTTAAQARRGKDIQGIPWERLNFTREKYRETRLENYKNYENLTVSHEELEKVRVYSTFFFELGISASL